MADKKSKKEIPDRVAEWKKKLPFISYTTPRAGHVSQYKDTANALLESMFGDKEKPKAGPKGNVKKMMNGGKVMGYKDGGSVSICSRREGCRSRYGTSP
jgi:hypothetical protein